MNLYSETILKDYQVRKTYKQKTRFLEYLTNILDEREIPYTIEEAGKILKTRNVVVGDVKSAKTILTAHYDTQPVLPFPNLITPLSTFGTVLYNVFLVGIIFLISYLVGRLLVWAQLDFYIAYLIADLVVYGLILYMFFGFANKHTANDNTSGVIVLLEILLRLESFDDVCIVFFDLEEVGLIGSYRFNKKHTADFNGYHLLINYDCVSDGDTYFFTIPKYMEKYKESLSKIFSKTEDKDVIITSKGYYPSDQMHFGFGIGCAALKKKGNIYYLDRIHTSRDIQFCRNNIEWFCTKTLDLIEKRKDDEIRK